MTTKKEFADKVMTALAPYEKLITKLVPRDMDGERFAQTVFFAIKSNPDLMQVFRSDSASVVGAVIECARNGLVPNGHRGEAYIVPFGRSASLMLGYPGIRKLVMNSGRYKDVFADCVWIGDTWSVELSPQRIVRHGPPGERYGLEEHVGASGEGIAGAYATVVFNDGNIRSEWRQTADLNHVRAVNKKRNRDKESPAWRDWPSMMYRKIPLVRLCKSLEISDEVQRIIGLDDVATGGGQQHLGSIIEADSTFMGFDEAWDEDEPETPPRDKSPPKRTMKPQQDGTAKAQAES